LIPRARPISTLLALALAAAALAVAGCGGDDDGGSSGSGGAETSAAAPEQDRPAGPVTAQEFAECIKGTGNHARPVGKADEADAVEAIRGAGVSLEQVTVEYAEDFSATAFVAVLETVEDAEKAEPAATEYQDAATRHGNVIATYLNSDTGPGKLEAVIEGCTPA
jgi:hypothetical protein